MPSLSSETTRLTCSSLVFCCFTEIVQQIHSLRANGVIFSQALSAISSEVRAFLKSVGISCTTPPEMVFSVAAIRQFYYRMPGFEDLSEWAKSYD